MTLYDSHRIIFLEVTINCWEKVLLETLEIKFDVEKRDLYSLLFIAYISMSKFNLVIWFKTVSLQISMMFH